MVQETNIFRVMARRNGRIILKKFDHGFLTDDQKVTLATELSKHTEDVTLDDYILNNNDSDLTANYIQQVALACAEPPITDLP